MHFINQTFEVTNEFLPTRNDLLLRCLFAFLCVLVSIDLPRPSEVKTVVLFILTMSSTTDTI